MIWKTPKKFIEQMLFWSSLFSLVFSLLVFGVWLYWKDNPEKITHFDLSIPNYHEAKINELLTYISHKKSAYKKFKSHKKIRKLLKDNTQINTFNDTYNESTYFVIEYLINNGEVDEAIQIANKWQNSQLTNFDVQFKYAEIMSSFNNVDSIAFVTALSEKYYDVPEVQVLAADFFIKNKALNLAYEVVKKFAKLPKRKQTPSFMIYYTDEVNKQFSQKTNLNISDFDYQLINQIYQIKSSIQAQGLSALRFDFDALIPGAIISELSFSVTEANTTYPISYNKVINIRSFGDNLISTTSDPYIFFELPEKLIGTKNPLLFQASFKIEKKHINPLDKILATNWSYTLDTSSDIFEQKFMPIGNDRYLSDPLDKILANRLTIIPTTIKNLNIENIQLIDESFDFTASQGGLSTLEVSQKQTEMLTITVKENSPESNQFLLISLGAVHE